MRVVLALFAAVAVACGAPVVEPRVPCATDADCPGGTICGKGSGRVNSAKPDAPIVAERPAECFPPCATELTDDCALPVCPTSGIRIASPDRFKEGGTRPDGWDEHGGVIRLDCGDLNAALFLTCDYRSGVLDVTGSPTTVRAWHQGIGGGCDILRDYLSRPDGWWPWSF